MTDWIAVPLAAIAAYAFGAVWYMLLGARWMVAVGLSEEQVKNGSKTPFVIAFIGALLVSGALRLLFARLGVDGALDGLRWGSLIGVFVALPWVVTNYAFADRPKALWWIDGGHAAIAIAIAGLVLGAIR